MSTHEVKLFEANFNVWKADRGTGLTESKAFERYVIEQVLTRHASCLIDK
jgi:hypothetical protein